MARLRQGFEYIKPEDNRRDKAKSTTFYEDRKEKKEVRQGGKKDNGSLFH